MRWYQSLRRTADFTRTQRRGRRLGFAAFHVYGLERPSGPARVGVSVPSSVGGAVIRNLVRRRIKGVLEALPPGAHPASQPIDVVFVVHPGAAQAGYPALARDVAEALHRLRADARPQAERRPRPR